MKDSIGARGALAPKLSRGDPTRKSRWRNDERNLAPSESDRLLLAVIAAANGSKVRFFPVHAKRSIMQFGLTADLNCARHTLPQRGKCRH
jgi:hypothetical protein